MITKNIKRSVLSLLILISSSVSFAQQLSERVDKLTPEFPGEVMIDFGFNFTREASSELDFNWFRSRSFSAYLIKPFELNKSFSFRPGLGVSVEKLGQKDPITIDYEVIEGIDGNNNPTVTRTLTYDTISGLGVSDFRKSQIGINHIEIPLELRYHFGGIEKKGMYLALGVSGAIMFESHTKVKYRSFGKVLKEKNKGDFNLTRFRYTAYARWGVGSFGVFYKWHFHDLFNSGGPAGTEGMGYSTIGISLSGF